jgi:2-polyprenyl-3-methyl-5-hydroxy-6-metoxy-1,4-benzoquinol methylase
VRDFRRLDQFLTKLSGDIYPEAPSDLHVGITDEMIAALAKAGVLAAGQRVLDVGCGQGLALERFAKLGLKPIGITLAADYGICLAKGHDVRAMDQSFLEFADQEFDLLWCRHVLEHSVFPFFTLSEYHRVTKPGGHVYIEVPAPDTGYAHQNNLNHYSVLGKTMWQELFRRVDLSLVQTIDIHPPLVQVETYWAFLLRRTNA